MSKHTEGPWAAWTKQGGCYSITGPSAACATIAERAVRDSRVVNDLPAYVISSKTQKAPAIAFGDTNDEALSNALLIAAAPDLLQVLQEFARVYGVNDVQMWMGVRDRALAAIAKATGKPA